MTRSEHENSDPLVSEALARVWRWREQNTRQQPPTPEALDALRREFGVGEPRQPGASHQAVKAKKSA